MWQRRAEAADRPDACVARRVLLAAGTAKRGGAEVHTRVERRSVWKCRRRKANEAEAELRQRAKVHGSGDAAAEPAKAPTIEALPRAMPEGWEMRTALHLINYATACHAPRATFCYAALVSDVKSYLVPTYPPTNQSINQSIDVCIRASERLSSFTRRHCVWRSSRIVQVHLT